MSWRERFQRDPRFIRTRMWLQKQTWKLQQSGSFVVFVMFYSLFLDNMLLTVIVPIVPEFLQDIEDAEFANISEPSMLPEDHVINRSLHCNSTFQEPSKANIWHKTSRHITEENDKVGLLLSSKALVQLIANPLAGMLTNRIGYRTPLFMGCIVLLLSSLMFAFGQTYAWLFAARSIQGLGSACIAISGMAMVADRYQEDNQRSKNMGIAMGGIALGVLVGYPFGGVMYDFFGKQVPLLTIFGLLLIDVVVQLVILRPGLEPERMLIGASVMKLLGDPYILLSAGAICLSTCVMATLEPCLPLWLMKVMSPPKWQLGTVFIPDSLGYLVGTTLFGSIAFRVGRWLTAMISMLIVGICAIMIPFSTHVLQLLVPHFGLGLGIGIIDASIMPLMAHLVDIRYVTLYGSVYAIAQLAVSFAYCFGPLIGGQLVRVLEFPWLMRGIGIMNIVYCPLCYFLKNPPSRDEMKAINLKEAQETMTTRQTGDAHVLYSTFNNEE